MTHVRRVAAAVLLFALGCGGEGPTEGGARVDGVWTTRLPIGAPSDSLLLVLEENGADSVNAIGYFAPLRTLVGGTGVRVDNGLGLKLAAATVSGGRMDIELGLEVQDDRYAGVAQVNGTSYPVVLRRADAGAGALAGRWVLSLVRGGGAGAGPASFDTLEFRVEGNARRGFANASCGYSVPGFVRVQAGEPVVVEYLSTFGYGPPCSPPVRDTLRSRGDTLVRTTQTVVGAREELYLRR